MSDYLYIDTDRARTAAAHLRSMSASGRSIAGDVHAALARVDLADSSGPRLTQVAEALVDLAGVLRERCDAADAGGFLPSSPSSAALADITEALNGYPAATPEVLFPLVGTSATSTPDDHGFSLPGVFGRLNPLLDTVADQPLLPSIDPWVGPIRQGWEVVAPIGDQIGDAAGDAWDSLGTVGDDIEHVAGQAWDLTTEFGSDVQHEVTERIDDIDWSALEEFGGYVVESATDPKVIALSMLSPLALVADIAGNYGVVSAEVCGFGVKYTKAGGVPQYGAQLPLTPLDQACWPSPSIGFMPADSIQESGPSLDLTVCDVVCAGVSVDANGVAHETVGFGPLGFSAGGHQTFWSQPGD